MKEKRAEIVLTLAITFDGIVDLLAKLRTEGLRYDMSETYRNVLNLRTTPLICEGPAKEVADFYSKILDSAYGNRVYVHRYEEYEQEIEDQTW